MIIYTENVIKKKIKQSNSILLLLFLSINLFGQTEVSSNQNKTNFNQTQTTITPHYSLSEVQDCKYRLITQGDMNDYMCIYFSKNKPQFHDGETNYYELLIPYSLIFANRYNNASACYDIYLFTTKLYEHYNMSMDSVTSKFLLHYLEKGALQNNSSCLRELSKIYEEGVFVPYDSVKASEYKQRYKSLLP